MRSDSGNGTVAGDGTVTGDQAGDADPYQEAPGDPVVLAELRAIREELAVLSQREQERAEHREAVIDRLHTENQMLRRQELEVMLEPVRSALYRLHHITWREAGRWTAPAPPDVRHVGALLSMIADEVTEVLARAGVEPFTPRPGDPYDAVRHRPVDTEQVADPRSDGTVTRTVSAGFRRGETVTRRAEVVVGRLDPAGATVSRTDHAEPPETTGEPGPRERPDIP